MPTTKDAYDILLIEDSPTDAMLVSESLNDVSHFKFRLVVASTLAEGGEKLSEKNFDAVILDLGLPDSTGVSTFDRIRVLAPETPVVILSGIDEFHVPDGAGKNRSVNFLTKNQASGIRIATAILSSMEEPTKAVSAQVNHLHRYLDALLRSSTNLLKSGVSLKDALSSFCLAIEEYGAEQIKSPVLVSILFANTTEGHLERGIAPSLPGEYIDELEGLPISSTAGSCGSAAHSGQSVFVTDTENDPLWQDYKHLARRFNLRACWSLPFFDSKGNLVGTFALYHRQPHSPTELECELIEESSKVLGKVMDRAQTLQS